MPHPANDNRAAAADLLSGSRRCPTCGRPQVLEFRPFCSKRCADIDLARWLGGRYAIPAAGDHEEGDKLADTGEDA